MLLLAAPFKNKPTVLTRYSAVLSRGLFSVDEVEMFITACRFGHDIEHDSGTTHSVKIVFQLGV